MLGDMFLVYNLLPGWEANSYSHCTIHRAVEDFTSRFLAAKPVVISLQLVGESEATQISSPQELHDYFIQRCQEEIQMSPLCKRAVESLSRLPEAIFIMDYTGGVRHLLFVPSLAREEIKRDDWKSMTVMLFLKGRLAETRYPSTNKAESLIAVDLWNSGMFKSGCQVAPAI